LQLGLESLEQAIAQGEAETARLDPALKQERVTRRRASRSALPAHLPRIEVTLEPEDTACPCCRGTMAIIDHDWQAQRSELPRRSFLQHQLLQSQVSHCTPQTPVLLLQQLQPLHLVQPQAAILGTPPVCCTLPPSPRSPKLPRPTVCPAPPESRPAATWRRPLPACHACAPFPSLLCCHRGLIFGGSLLGGQVNQGVPRVQDRVRRGSQARDVPLHRGLTTMASGSNARSRPCHSLTAGPRNTRRWQAGRPACSAPPPARTGSPSPRSRFSACL